MSSHLNPAVRLVRKFFVIHVSSSLWFAIFIFIPPLLYHHNVLVFTHCKYSPSASTALAAVGKFDWKKVKPNFLKQTFACFVFCIQIVFFPREQSFQFIQLGHFILAQYLGAFLGAALVFFTYKVRPRYIVPKVFKYKEIP